jgi:hypothetical protein
MDASGEHSGEWSDGLKDVIVACSSALFFDRVAMQDRRNEESPAKENRIFNKLLGGSICWVRVLSCIRLQGWLNPRAREDCFYVVRWA